MIYCLSLNPCLDKTLSVDAFSLDAPNRVRVERADVGGKGVNVARAVIGLGGEARLIGFDFENTPVGNAMREEKIPCELLELPGALRVNLKLRDLSAGRTIEINESGSTVTPEQLRSLSGILLDSVRPGDLAALSGSVPPGVPKSVYRDLCTELKKRGCFVAADCDGEALKLALEAGPDLIKPNEQEFSALTGADPLDGRALCAEMERLHEKGVGRICLSLGAKGAMMSLPGKRYFCAAAKVEALGLQGAGDCMLAALLYRLNGGAEAKDALRFAVAAGGAAVMLPGTQSCRAEDVRRLYGTLSVDEV